MKANSYRGLPALAGVATFEQGAKAGLSVDDCVKRLKRFHWAFRRLHQIFVHRLVSEPVYELKMGFSLHAHYCAEHAAALRSRVSEMREPPLGLDAVPDLALDVLFDEILSAPGTELLLLGVYEVVVPALAAALKKHLELTNPIVDHPSVRVCRFALLEVEEMMQYGAGCIAGMVGGESRMESGATLAHFQRLLAQAGGLDGAKAPLGGEVERLLSAQGYKFDPVPRRDERFKDPYNMGVHAEAFLYDPEMPSAPKVLMLYYKRLREIDVPEVIAAILAETQEKPWGYTVDLTRQLWDEARHAMMGEIGFVRAGIDWPQFVPVNFTWSLALNTQLTAKERHAVLYFIEQGLMPKTGKRFEWEVGIDSGDTFAALAQDYDWADEVLHARIGRDWYVKEVGDTKQAIAYGDECWARVLIDWEKYRREGLTQHENWWPEVYREWCRIQGKDVDAKVEAYATDYSAIRADLRDLTASA
ncbi:MAG: hypothetical protein EBS01_00180 [Verrucomicrobia bacterium]|nr:hypothetical protein [Verrucomicrobiota bacterium]